jgi:hypothetical protein
MVVVETDSISGSTDPLRRRLAAQWSSWMLVSPESPYFGLAAGRARNEHFPNTISAGWTEANSDSVSFCYVL